MGALFNASATDCDFNERRTVYRIPHKHGACLEATTNLLNPFVVERHPLWPLAVWDVARLCRLPEVIALEVSVEIDRI